jgi:TolB-like protein/DNA-binding winged helix-turn-helix (wHTH) protein/Tfp pilus assembly protein PilF
MSTQVTGPEIVRFGDFALDLRSGELARNGDRILLPDQPFRLLVTLVRQPGELVTRDSLRRELWADDTFVDFEHSLNAAIKRLREALGDSALTPRFIETLPRRGYRFIAVVEVVEQNGQGLRRDGAVAPSSQGAEAAALGPSAPSGSTPLPGRRSARVKLAYGLAVALVVLTVLTVASRPPALWTDASPVIAVLPFQNLGVEAENEYLADGLTDEIILALSMIDGLGVRSRTSSFVFKTRRPASIRQVGELLEANLVLEGSVLRNGERLRVNAQLVRIADDVSLWSGRFDREMKDLFEIQDEISRSIVNALRLKLGRGQRRYNTNVDVYELFLKARGLQTRRDGDARRAVSLFEQVVQKDSAFAPAHAGLAGAYAALSYMFPSPGGFAIPQEQGAASVRPAALRAIELDPLLADAHVALAHLHTLDREWTKAEASFRRALELNPRLTATYTDFVLTALLPQGKLDEAMQRLESALRFDPISLDVRRVLALVQIDAGLYDRAIENCERVLKVDPDYPFVAFWRVRAMFHKGQRAEAIAWLEKEGDRGEGYLGYAYAMTGRRGEAERLAAGNEEFPQRQLLIYSGLGDKNRAFEALQRFADLNPRRAGAYMTRPELTALRGDPRLNEIRKTIGLAPL